MTELIMIIFGLIFLFVLILAIIAAAGSNRKGQLKNIPISDNLGIQDEGMLPIIQSLEKALPFSYTNNVKKRVLMDNPKWNDHEFDWIFFELKRYFAMTSLLKTVPMFSEKADVIWHEMLMFTKEYESFSSHFYKEFLHHTPNLDSTPIPGERAFFDWVYLSLFESTSNSSMIWGGFLKYPIKLEILEDFKQLPEKELLNKYFKQGDDWLDVKKYLIHKLKTQIAESETMKLEKKPLALKRVNSENQFSYLLLAAVFYSSYEAGQYEENMNDLLPPELAKGGYGGGSSCSGFSCSSSSDSDSGGGSSCSSCGGGCSS